MLNIQEMNEAIDNAVKKGYDVGYIDGWNAAIKAMADRIRKGGLISELTTVSSNT